MGGGTYSAETRSHYVAKTATKTTDQIFTQNKVRRIHKDMDPMRLGIRESRDSTNHPNSIPIIIALDVTGSMGHIPEEIVKEDLTIIMEALINAGISHPQIMFLGIGDHYADKAPLQVGQFESADQELAMWLENTWLERGGSSINAERSKESYPLAWLVAGRHTSTDSFEKRGKKGYLFTIGDEGFHTKYDPTLITGEPCQEPYYAETLLNLAREKYHVFHVHANYTAYRNSSSVIGQWEQIMGSHFIMANNNKEIVLKITQTILKSEKAGRKRQEAEGNHQNPAPDTNEKPNTNMDIL